MHNFKGQPDGSNPFAGLIDVNGTLYGTTQYGGTNGLGTIFKVSASGKEQVLYNFAGPPADGQHPVAGMTLVNGVLYGTASEGGQSAVGMVFKLVP